MKKLLLIISFIITSLSIYAQTACTQNYSLACDEEKRLNDEKKKIECRLAEIQRDKQTLIACMSAEQNKAELDKLKNVLISTLNEVNRIQSQPIKLPVPCVNGNCN